MRASGKYGLKRFVAREIFGYLYGAKTPPTALMIAP
jgi:hypothetical protein